MKVNDSSSLMCDLSLFWKVQHGPILTVYSRVEEERTRWDPKDGELFLSRTKPEETLVEVRSGSDVQIDRLTWV
jgi:hypothetical protein